MGCKNVVLNKNCKGGTGLGDVLDRILFLVWFMYAGNVIGGGVVQREALLFHDS